jgi:hypothetical protein
MQSSYPRQLPRALRIFCAVVVASTATTWGIVALSIRKHLSYPYTWPFFIRADTMHDYWDYFERFKLLHHAEFFSAPGYPFTYMAPGAVLYQAFYSMGLKGGELAYFLVALVSLLAGCALLLRSMLARGLSRISSGGFLLLLVLTSYPIIFCIDRGNLEIVIAIGVSLGMWAYCKDRTWLAAVLWGVSGSVKLYPLILLAMFFSRAQVRQFLAGLASAVCATLLSLLYLGPDLHTAAQGIFVGLGAFFKMYTLQFEPWIGFDHSLFALLKIVTLAPVSHLAALWHNYFVVCAVSVIALYIWRIRKLPVVNRLLFLTICSILLPPTSWDYTLVQLYAPFAALIFVAIDAGDSVVAGLVPAFVVFALLFTPTNFLFLGGAGLSAQIKCLLLITLLVLSVRYPLPGSAAAAQCCSYTRSNRGHRT